MEALYSVMQGLESRLGGGEGVEGIYGSITATGMHKVLECMKHNCGLGRNSTLIDIGAGLGRPLLHALLLHGVAHGYGVELDRVKVAKAEAFCKGVVDELALRGVLQHQHPQPHQPNQQQQQGMNVNMKSNNMKGGDEGDSGCKDADTSAGGNGAAAAGAVGGSNADDGGVVVVVASQGSCLGSQEAECTAGVGAAGGSREEPSRYQGDVLSDDTQAHADCSQAADATTTTAAAAVASEDSSKTAATAAGSGKAVAQQKKGQKGSLQWPASRPIITCAAIEQIASLDPGTHAYSFWEGVPLSGKQAFGRLFRSSRSMKAVAVVQRAMRGQAPESVMAELGFGPLLLIKAFPVSMSGSGRSFTAYVFSKVVPITSLLRMQQQQSAGVAATTDAASQQPQQQQKLGQLPEVDDVLASSSKPPRGSRLAHINSKGSNKRDDKGSRGDAAAGGGDTAAAAAASDSSDSDDEEQEQQQRGLIPLLTEARLAELQQQQQQGQGASPAKRLQQGGGSGAAGSAGGSAGDADDGSPSKKQRGLGLGGAGEGASDGAGGGGWLARGGPGLYGLRPRQLSQSYSQSSGCSSYSTAGTGGTSGGGRRAGLRSSSSLSRGSSMSVDQPFVGSGGGGGGAAVAAGAGGGGSSRGKGTRSTAVSGGGGSSRSKTKQQPQQDQGGGSADAGGGGAKGSSRRGAVRKGDSAGRSSSGVSAAVSEARADLAALDV